MERPKQRNIATEPIPNNEVYLPQAAITIISFPDSANADQRQANDNEGDVGLFERLGLRLLAVNAATFALMLVSIVLLFFLWFGDHENSTWRHIMLEAWIGQAITLCSVAVRLAVGTQAGTAVAFLASISLESSGNSGILVEHAPAFSVARCINAGPMASFCLFWRNIYQKRDRSILALMGLLATTSFVSQFTSTLLLWDVQPRGIQGFPVASRIPFGGLIEDYLRMGIGAPQDDSNYWASATAEYPIFAEWSSPPNLLPDHIRDTGPTIRALLLIISTEERSAITQYAGPASLFDARVVCNRPDVTNFTFGRGNRDETLYFTGKLEPMMTDHIDDVLVSHDSGYIFNCTLAELTFLDSKPLYKVCGLQPDAGGLMSSLDPTQNSAINQTYTSLTYPNDSFSEYRWWAKLDGSENHWPIELGHTVLFMSASVPLNYHGSWVLSSAFNSEDAGVPNTEKRGPWLDFVSTGSGSGIRLSITVCYDALYHSHGNRRVKHLQDFPIIATKPTNQSEPKLSWNSSSGAFDTNELRSQLDGKYYSTKGRAVMDLDLTNAKRALQEHVRTLMLDGDSISNWDVFEYRDSRTVNPFNLSTSLSGIQRDRTMDFLNIGSWSPFKMSRVDSYSIWFRSADSLISTLARYYSGVISTEVHYVIDQVVQQILEETDNPALAWQALTTFVMRSAYYDRLPTFSAEETVTITRVVSCLIPVGCTGFAIAMVNILVHHALVIAALVWFICSTKYSRINCAWQAVAQIKASETKELLDKATMVDDKMVKQWVEKDESLRERRFKIKLEPGNGRVCLS